MQDNLIRDYVINVISRFNTKVAQVYIYRKKHKIIIRTFSYNDSFTNWNSYLVKHKKKHTYKNNCLDYFSRKHEDIFNSSSYDSGQFKKAVNKKQDFCSLQKRMESNRKNFFIESEIIKKIRCILVRNLKLFNIKNNKNTN